jgi:hypothetical protein
LAETDPLVEVRKPAEPVAGVGKFLAVGMGQLGPMDLNFTNFMETGANFVKLAGYLGDLGNGY